MDTECANEFYKQEDGSQFRIQILRNEGVFKVFIDLFQNESPESHITTYGPYNFYDKDGITHCDMAMKKAREICDEIS